MMVETIKGMKVNKLTRRMQMLLGETPTHQMGSVFLCIQKRGKP